MSSRRRRDTDNMSNNKPSTETPPLGIRNGLLSSGSTVGLKSASSNIRYRLLWVLLGAVFAGIATYQSRILSVRHLGHAATQLPESYALCTDPGKVYTVDEVKPNVDCMLVRRDRIMATGSLEDVEAEWDVYQNELIAKFYGNELKAKKPLKVLNTPTGSIVIPGLADAHAHLIQYGFKMQLQLDGADTLEDVLDRVEAYIKAHPDVHADHDRWIEGYGWDQTRWNGWRGGFPTAADLATRPILASRPLSLFRVDSHALWISPRALELVQAQLPHGKFPEPGELKGGEVVRDDQGEPTGVFVDAAMALVPVPPWSQRQMEEYFQRAVKDALRVGLTSVHDAAATPEIIDVFRKMADEGQLPIRIYAMGNSESTEYWGSTIPRLENYGKDGRLNLRSVKLFTDGALGSWGAALLEPYSDNPSTSGLMRSSEQALAEIVKRFWDDGWGVNIHCIGDRANKAVLDIFEGLLANSSRTAEERRPRIEHAQIMRPEDLKRAGRLGVITSVQPTHATSDMWYAESRLGSVRINGAYAYQSLLQSSPRKVLPLGSDFPVEDINPLLGFYAAVSRLDAEGSSPHGSDGWFPAERLTRSQALKGMTLDAAYASFAEHELGSIVVGKKADFVVLDTDIVHENTLFPEILTASVQATVIDGRIVYGGI